MTEIYTIRPTLEQLAQAGTSGVSEVTFPHLMVDVTSLNFIFDFGVSNDSEQGRAIDPPVTFTNAAESSYYTLTISTNITVIPATSQLYMQFYNDPTMDLLSNTNNPTTSGTDSFNAVSNIELNIASTSDAWVLPSGSSTYVLQWSLDWDATYYTASGFSNDEEIPFAFRDLTRDVLWNGRLGFSLTKFIGGINPIITAVSLTGPAIEFHTGRSGSSASQGRSVFDMKTGLPAFAPELQEDGFIEGIWTRPETWDHKDPMEESPYEPPDTERDREDDYPL